MKKRYIGMIAGGTAAVLLIGGISAYAVWNQKDIGAGEAKKIAYEDAGISESDVERVHVLKDRDDGRLVYEIGFVEADYQYNYEIAASNGKILDKEIEQITMFKIHSPLQRRMIHRQVQKRQQRSA